MGSLRRFDLGRIRSVADIGELVETGSGQGDSLAWARAAGIAQCWSVELHPELARRSQRRFADDPAVTVAAGDSREFLARLPASRQARLYFLDAHFAGGADFGLADYVVSAAHEASFPLLGELDVLLPRLRAEDLVIIDDARMYFEGGFQNGECPEFARRWHEQVGLIERLERLGASHSRLLLREDEGYLLLLPRHLADGAQNWLRPLPHDAPANASRQAVGGSVAARTSNANFTELTPQALFDASFAALRGGRIAQARAGFEALRTHPALGADATHMLGVAAGVEGDHEGAVTLIRDAIAVDRSRPEYFANLSVALERVGRFDAARMARNDVGVALHVAGRFDDAVKIFEQVLAATPSHLATLVDIAASLQELGQYGRALESALRVMHRLCGRDARIAPVIERIGTAFPDERAAATRRAGTGVEEILGEVTPSLLPKALNNCGNSLLRLGRVELAEECYVLSSELAPEEAIVRWNLSHLRLLRGDFGRGFELYESRWQWPGFNFPERNLTKPRWTGGSPEGQRLLVYAEQGYGDTIQFARLVPRLAARGACVWFEVQPELFWLMKAAFRSEARVEVIPRLADPRSVYADPPIDAHCGVMSLAKLLGVTLGDLPVATSYLAADPEAATRWSVRLGERVRPRIGVVWAGRPDHARDRERSVALSDLGELFAVPGVDWISLQTGAPRLQIAATGLPVRDVAGDLRDFRDTAALIENLDLVITVDTAVGHLAAAMGKPVWILLSQMPDWRWLLDRDDSPWYPSVRLFRQHRLGDWTGVVQEVAGAVRREFALDSAARSAEVDCGPRDGKAPTSCKVCGCSSPYLGTVDFAKNCQDPDGVRTPRSGVAVPYYCCSRCGLLFTSMFDHWDKARFRREIYNEAYSSVDPDFGDVRPRDNARLVASLLGERRDLRILDYGGGNHRLAQRLRADGFDCASWDPLYDEGRPPPARGTYDVVTAFEVFEHSPTPRATLAEAASFLHGDGVLVFSTLTVEPECERRLAHWYVAPRNGHITIYTRQALDELGRRIGSAVRHVNDNLHYAWRKQPLWLDVSVLEQFRPEAVI